MKKSLKVLHVEDSPEDSILVQHMLQDDGLECEIQRVQTRAQLFEALEHSPCDLILSDCTLPQFSGLQALEIAHALKPQVPFIFVSGTIGEETAIKSLQDGATDYVLKHRLSRLVPAVRRALTESNERTMRRAMEKRLQQARRLESIGRLAGGLAHDFNNLLQVLKAHIGLLPLESREPDQVIRIAELLDKTTDRGSDMMKELLVFARKTEAHLASIDIAAQINETASMLKVGLPSNINLVVQLAEDLPPVFADPGQMDRILTNLVVNARDAMPQGGDITISADVVQFDPMPPHAWQGDDSLFLCLKVSDTGMGMDEATRLRAFEPFFSTKPIGQGTGLGLSVVFGLMQVHNGFIDIQSKPGEGTAISLFFPLLHGVKVNAKMIKKIPPFQLLGDAFQADELAA
jgi:two-component system cell cycle sensor histidine kinase/response regulator CckA